MMTTRPQDWIPPSEREKAPWMDPFGFRQRRRSILQNPEALRSTRTIIVPDGDGDFTQKTLTTVRTPGPDGRAEFWTLVTYVDRYGTGHEEILEDAVVAAIVDQRKSLTTKRRRVVARRNSSQPADEVESASQMTRDLRRRLASGGQP